MPKCNNATGCNQPAACNATNRCHDVASAQRPSGPTTPCQSLGRLAGYASPEEMLIADNKRLREAGCELAEAAMRVAKTYDGVHRLMLASSKWALAIANEGGRERHQHNAEVRGGGLPPFSGPIG